MSRERPARRRWLAAGLFLLIALAIGLGSQPALAQSAQAPDAAAAAPPAGQQTPDSPQVLDPPTECGWTGVGCDFVDDDPSDCGPLEIGCHINGWIYDASGLEDLKEGTGEPKKVVGFISTMPQYGDAEAQPKIHEKLSLMQAMALGLVPLMLVISAIRYWVAGVTGTSSHSALMAVWRAIVAVAFIVTLPTIFDMVQNLMDAITLALLASTENSTGRLLSSFNNMGTGGPVIFVVSVGGLIMVILFAKTVLALMLGVFFVLMPVAAACWILEEFAWFGRGTVQGSIGILFFGPSAACVFMVWGAFEPVTRDFAPGDTLKDFINWFYALAGLYLVYKIPVTIVKQMGFGSAVPAPSRMLAFAALGRMAIGRAGGVAPQVRAAPTRPAPARQPTDYSYQRSGGASTQVHTPEPGGGGQTWSRSDGGTSESWRLRPQEPAPAGTTRRQRPPNVERVGGDAPPRAPRHAQQPGAVRRGGQVYNPAGAGAGAGGGTVTRMSRDDRGVPLPEESRRFADLPRGQGGWEPSQGSGVDGAPPMSNIARHGAGEQIGAARSGDPSTGTPTRTFYEPVTYARDAGIRQIQREQHANGTERWSASFRDPVTRAPADLSGPEIRWVLHGLRS